MKKQEQNTKETVSMLVILFPYGYLFAVTHLQVQRTIPFNSIVFCLTGRDGYRILIAFEGVLQLQSYSLLLVQSLQMRYGK